MKVYLRHRVLVPIAALILVACGGRVDGDDPGGVIDPWDGGADANSARGGADSGNQGGTGGAGARGGSGGIGGSTSSGGTSGGTGGSGVGGNSTGGAAGTTGGSGGTGGTPPMVVCASASHCAAGQECCFSNGQCFDPVANRAACPLPMPDTAPPGRKACASNADCAADSFCYGSGCLSAGFCMNRTTECGDWPGPLCGCDGNDYSDLKAACRAGVRVAATQVPANCGKAPPRDGSAGGGRAVCGSNAQCGMGEACCLITGRCYDLAMPALCTFSPPGTFDPCIDDTECAPPSTACWSSNCTGPGYCKGLVFGACSSVLDPVCGCDGKSYTNEECAWQQKIRVLHRGVCPSP